MGNGPKSEEAPQRMIILVGVDSDECDRGYGVMREDAFDEWRNAPEPEDGDPNPDRFSLLFGGYDKCDTFDTFEGAMQLIIECEGRLVNVHAAIAY